ncbi:hypothetical protein [Pseudoalteromonas piscicida]|uniref:Uncharacterized protein n=1 Tax=Pseudoalteromonas piscicida TaxID=43662 RepID=A0A2A5JL84_PSEO7|nr:hypothetical protein [Pseudoalteromonas piscicida]PCK30213.1 hypothetical protein CEX98_18845 [Pseudoalteromonas piscicida]
MKLFNALLSATLLISAHQAVASCNKYTCEGVSNVVFSSVVANNTNVKIKFHEGTSATLSCNLDSEHAAPLNQQSPNFRNMQSMLLTAVAANLPVVLSFDKASSRCVIESVEVKVVE